MDAKRFDRFAKTLASHRSRRSVLQVLGSGLGASVTAFGKGPLILQDARSQGLECHFHTVTLWFNAFIPLTVRKDDLITRYTRTVKGGPHYGKTMIPGPPHTGCFLTDQRSFRNYPEASSRMHSEITIDLDRGVIIGFQSGTHGSSGTTEVACDTGEVLCQTTATIRGRKFYDFQVSPSKRRFVIYLQAAASDPCITGAPDIDYEGRFTVEVSRERDELKVSFSGLVDGFPAFEAWASTPGQTPERLFTKSPKFGNTPWNVIGLPADRVSGFGSWRAQCPAGLDCCDGICVDKLTDPMNCGLCREICSELQICTDEDCTCAPISCESGFVQDSHTCLCVPPLPLGRDCTKTGDCAQNSRGTVTCGKSDYCSFHCKDHEAGTCNAFCGTPNNCPPGRQLSTACCVPQGEFCNFKCDCCDRDLAAGKYAKCVDHVCVPAEGPFDPDE